jgi:hypothetical protein
MRKHAQAIGINFGRTDLLRTKLTAEISEYERQLSELKNNGNQVNFTMIQTYKELIAARKDMLKRLPVIF